MASSPPLSPAQIVAIGPTGPLPIELRRALSPRGFSPLPAPAESDWLSVHPERGQSFADFVAKDPLVPDAARRTLVLCPIGAAAPALETLTAALAAFYGLPARVTPVVPLSSIRVRSRVNARTSKRQLLTGDLLAFLKRTLPADAFAVAGVTAEDLYPGEEWNFVFGQARLRDRVGVFSFARHDPTFDGDPPAPGDAAILLRRMIKVLLHEVGHMFGVKHCVYFTCLMNGSNHMEETDKKPIQVCPVCLRKLVHAVGFDATARYEALERFFAGAGLPDEAAWVRDRLAEIRARRQAGERSP